MVLGQSLVDLDATLLCVERPWSGYWGDLGLLWEDIGLMSEAFGSGDSERKRDARVKCSLPWSWGGLRLILT